MKKYEYMTVDLSAEPSFNVHIKLKHIIWGDVVMKKRKNIILSVLVIFIIAMICGTILYFNNRNLNYKPNGKLNYDSDDGSARTIYEIEVTENLKGNLQNLIKVTYPGGYDEEGTLILHKGDYITDEELPKIGDRYIFVGIGQPNGTILLQDLYADIPYTEENKEKYLEYINNQENVNRERFKSIYEN